MDITLKKIDELTHEDFVLMAKWSNDIETKHFTNVNREEKELEDINPEELFQGALKRENKIYYYIMLEDKPIGEISIIKNFEFLAIPNEKTAWISIGIGEKEYRGLGFGEMAMKLLEKECISLGYEKIELGVFSFNTRAYNLYKKLGYKEIKINHDFTFYDGKWRDDIRMQKTII